MNHGKVPDISVTLVNFNTAGLLRDCLKSILQGEWRSSIEIIVADNASTDGSAAMLRQEFPQVKLIANEEYGGFAFANNQAFEMAQGRYLLMINTDTVVLPGALDAMVEFLDQHPEAGAVGCKLLNPDGSLQRSCWRGFPSLKTALVDALYLWRLTPNFSWVRASEVSEDELKNAIEVDHLLGASILIRREALEQIGFLNEKYMLFLVETDLCLRIKQVGWRIYFDPKGQVIHYGQQTGRQFPVSTADQAYRSYYRFCREYGFCSAAQLLLLKGTFMISSLIRIGLWIARMSSRDHELCRGMVKAYWNVLIHAPSF
jgi:GT2 family glycosyltransferase